MIFCFGFDVAYVIRTADMWHMPATDSQDPRTNTENYDYISYTNLRHCLHTQKVRQAPTKQNRKKKRASSNK